MERPRLLRRVAAAIDPLVFGSPRLLARGVAAVVVPVAFGGPRFSARGVAAAVVPGACRTLPAAAQADVLRVVSKVHPR